MIRFCEYCLKDVKCEKKEKYVTEYISKYKVSYLKKYYICSECNKEFMAELAEDNMQVVNAQLRSQTGLIKKSEIEDILKKYNIGKKPLSLILGLGEVTISRYFEGGNPNIEISQLLKQINDNPLLYELFLISNKEKITEIAYKKSLGKTKQLQLSSRNSRLYEVSLYFIKKISDITPLSLQKILYFTNGFSSIFYNKMLFEESPEAWIYGPVYEEIYNCFSYFNKNVINYDELFKDQEFSFTNEEYKFLNKMCLLFGCYSGGVLTEMSHLTTPWIDARGDIESNIPLNVKITNESIKDYFKEVCKEYNINTIDEIKKYSTDLFNKSIERIENTN